MVANRSETDYRQTIETWRDGMETQLRAENGWLTVVGLYWLKKGENTVGSAPNSDVVLPGSAPAKLGVIEFDGAATVFRVKPGVEAQIDGVSGRSATLRDDHDDSGATLVSTGSVSFFIIKRGEQYAVRVKDAGHSARRSFKGRSWYPVDERYRVRATFRPHTSERSLDLETSAGTTTALANPGVVEFDLRGKHFRLEAFAANEGQVWLIFRDKTSGLTTYGAGRFLYADVNEAGIVDLDFNKAYHPPCAFTHFATCPLPPRQNVLPVSIRAGERYARSRRSPAKA